MPNQQLARGIWTQFSTEENPFGVPNGMEENLRHLDDHLALYTLLPPQAPGTPLPANPVDGDGQAYSDGSYATFNGGTWRTYAPRNGVRVVLASGTESWLNTGTGWEQFSVVDTGPAVAAAVAAATGVAVAEITPLMQEAQAARDEAVPAASAAQAARTGAEAARDAAMVNANVYASTENGLAASINGQQFMVIVGDEIVRYRRDSASVATEVARYPTAGGSLIYRGAPANAALDFNTTTTPGLWLINGPQYNPPQGVLYPGLLVVRKFGAWVQQEYIPTGGSAQYGGQKWSRLINTSPSSIGAWISNYGYMGALGSVDLNTIRTAGIYHVNIAPTNKPNDPEALNNALLSVEVFGDNIVQQYMSLGSDFKGLIWTRTIIASTNTIGEWYRNDFYKGFLTTGDANNLRETGNYLIGAQLTNLPEISGWLTVSRRGDWVLQEIITLYGERRQTRNYRISTATWSSWVTAQGAIASGSVTSTALADGAVGSSKLADGAVNTSKLASDSVDASKLSPKYDWVATLSSGDVNDYTTDSGGWMVAGAMTNAPTGSGWLFVHKFGSTGQFILQRWHDFTDPSVFWVRKYYNGWSAWTKIGGGSQLKTNKNIVCMGDSITENGDYPARLATITGATVTNCGFGGSRLAFSTGDYAYLSFHKLAGYIASGDYSELIAACDRLAGSPVYDDNRAIAARLAAVNWSAVDYLIAEYGTNDYAADIPLGVVTDPAGTTFRGAMNEAVNKISTAYPNIKILFVAPMWRSRLSGAAGTADADTNTNGIGKYLIEYVDAMKEIAALHKMPCIDMYRTSGINKYNASTLLSDGLHPSAGVGYQRVAEKIAAGLNSEW